jgi:hypothetical protein
MDKEKIFVDGLIFKAPDEKTKEKAPWIKGKISVKVPEFINFLNKHNTNGGWVNIDLKKSKEKGTLYLELNTYVKKDKSDDLDLDEKDHTAVDPITPVDYPTEDIEPEDIPF